MTTTPEAPAPTSTERDGIQLSDVSSDQLAPLLDMMQEFNALEDIPWSRDDVTPAVMRLLDSPELGVIAHILEGGTLRGYVVLTWGFDLEWAGRDAFLKRVAEAIEKISEAGRRVYIAEDRT